MDTRLTETVQELREVKDATQATNTNMNWTREATVEKMNYWLLWELDKLIVSLSKPVNFG
jgi:hypothetical protein